MKNVVIAALAAAACAIGSSGASASPPDAQPGIVLQRPGVYSFMVGDVRVTALSDGTVPIDLHLLLRGTTPARTDALLARGFLANPVEASINAYLLEIGTRRVLVDTGAGDLFGPSNGGRLLDGLPPRCSFRCPTSPSPSTSIPRRRARCARAPSPTSRPAER